MIGARRTSQEISLVLCTNFYYTAAQRQVVVELGWYSTYTGQCGNFTYTPEVPYRSLSHSIRKRNKKHINNGLYYDLENPTGSNFYDDLRYVLQYHYAQGTGIGHYGPQPIPFTLSTTNLQLLFPPYAPPAQPQPSCSQHVGTHQVYRCAMSQAIHYGMLLQCRTRQY